MTIGTKIVYRGEQGTVIRHYPEHDSGTFIIEFEDGIRMAVRTDELDFGPTPTQAERTKGRFNDLQFKGQS